jgi:HPt (histidine-containing phosphotransfer) domain-containing protein
VSSSEVTLAGFNDDLELQRLFAGEIEERSTRLVGGAARLAEDASNDDGFFGDMVREGHTIKGTARMMGYSAVSDAGKLLEDIWRSLREGEIEPDPVISASLERLATELNGAVFADPATGTPGLAAGMRHLRRALTMDRLAIEELTPERSDARGDYGDLGGLLGSLDSWAFGENTRVNAAGLFRLINEVCSLRVDAEAVVAAVGDVTRSLDDPAALEGALVRLGAMVSGTEKAVIDLQTRAVDLAAAPLSEITGTFPQLVRYVSRKAGKEIRLELVGDQHTADRQVLERLCESPRESRGPRRSPFASKRPTTGCPSSSRTTGRGSTGRRSRRPQFGEACFPRASRRTPRRCGHSSSPPTSRRPNPVSSLATGRASPSSPRPSSRSTAA